MYRKILVPLDGSELAEAVLPHVYALAECAGSEIVLLRVITNPAFEFAFADPHIADRVIQDIEEENKTYMANIEARIKSKGYRVSTEMPEGPVAPTILEVAHQVKADLIAMSTHGRTGPARWVLGSVADKVVRNSTIPVLLIRPTTGNH